MRRQAVTGRREAVMLLRALRSTDPSWKLSVVEDDPRVFGVRRKVWVLSQGTQMFCRGYSPAMLLRDFVDTSRLRHDDRSYVSVNGFRLPGALMSAVDVDDLVTRLKLLF